MLRFAYLDLLDMGIAKHDMAAVTGLPAECAFPLFSAHEDLKHIKEGSNVNTHLCAVHYKEARQCVHNM